MHVGYTAALHVVSQSGAVAELSSRKAFRVDMNTSRERFVTYAKLGIGVLVIPQKLWDVVQNDLVSYDEVYRAEVGGDPPPPFSGGNVFCDGSQGAVDSFVDLMPWGTPDQVIERSPEELARPNGSNRNNTQIPVLATGHHPEC